jgi:hypothetical protein
MLLACFASHDLDFLLLLQQKIPGIPQGFLPLILSYGDGDGDGDYGSSGYGELY